jgi:hypothetical protein
MSGPRWTPGLPCFVPASPDTRSTPRWDRYGDAPLGLVEEGNIYTLEYGAPVPGRGYIGLEEDVLVKANGLEWLSTPQRELWLVD